MNPFGKKGQSDTFKLLIAAVVAMAILAIVAAVLAGIDPTELDCVGNPITEMTTTVSQAQSGIERSTGTICLQPGESFTADSLEKKMSGVSPITFSCYQGSAICEGENAPLEVDSSTITASQRAQFSGLVECTEKSNGDHECEIKIRSPL
jgi:hypothetical protein